jgi:hypothetical protein
LGCQERGDDLSAKRVQEFGCLVEQKVDGNISDDYVGGVVFRMLSIVCLFALKESKGGMLA